MAEHCSGQGEHADLVSMLTLASCSEGAAWALRPAIERKSYLLPLVVAETTLKGWALYFLSSLRLGMKSLEYNHSKPCVQSQATGCSSPSRCPSLGLAPAWPPHSFSGHQATQRPQSSCIQKSTKHGLKQEAQWHSAPLCTQLFVHKPSRVWSPFLHENCRSGLGVGCCSLHRTRDSTVRQVTV